MVGTARQWSLKAAGKLGIAERFLGPDRGDPIVLMYHGAISDVGGVPAVGDHKHLGETLFRGHLDLLAARRRVVPLSTLVNTVLAGGDSRGMVALTFDDGYLNNVECAARVLKEYSMSAAFFIATGFVGAQRWVWTDRVEHVMEVAEAQDTTVAWSDGGTFRAQLTSQPDRARCVREVKSQLKHLDWQIAEGRVHELGAALKVPESAPHGQYRFMSWDQARELAQSGFEVGAHTINHAILSRVPLASAEAEILGSQAQVRTATGGCCPTFCYPNGKFSDFTPGVQEICARNFDAALSAEPGAVRREDRFALRRIGVDHGTSVPRLAARILEGL
jgi:peptidoglycan/xylan/chitin deacetylase (PgdA/CDA1 family)